MNGECEKCSEHSLDCHCKGELSKKMVDAVVRLGRAQQFLKNILDDDGRCPKCLNDNLWILMSILTKEIKNE